jgi:hypothetical protein
LCRTCNTGKSDQFDPQYREHSAKVANHLAPDVMGRIGKIPVTYQRTGSRLRFAHQQAPAGGMIVRGLFYPGGKMIPSANLPQGSSQMEQPLKYSALSQEDAPTSPFARLQEEMGQVGPSPAQMFSQAEEPRSPYDRLRKRLGLHGTRTPYEEMMGQPGEQDVEHAAISADLIDRAIERKIETLPPDLRKVVEDALEEGNSNILLDLGIISEEEALEWGLIDPEQDETEGLMDQAEDFPPEDLPEGYNQELPPEEVDDEEFPDEYGDEDADDDEQPARQSRIRHSRCERGIQHATELLPHEREDLRRFAAQGAILQYDGSGRILDRDGDQIGRFHTSDISYSNEDLGL